MKVGSIDDRKGSYVGEAMDGRQAIVRLRCQKRMRIKLGNDLGNDVGNDEGLFYPNQQGGQDKQKKIKVANMEERLIEMCDELNFCWG